MMCLRFVLVVITRLAAWLRLSRREPWKTAEILILRHQSALLRSTPADVQACLVYAARAVDERELPVRLTA